MPLQFMASLAGRMITIYVAITLLFCGIYLIEQLVPLLETALRYAFDGIAFGKLLLLAMPRIIDFALPLAALCVSYFCILEARERREFLVIAAAGAGSTHLVVTVLVTGAIAAGISLAISGAVKPAASFAFRSTFTAAVNEVLSKEIPIGAFYSQQDRVLYSRSSEAQPHRILRLFEFEGERLHQVAVSDCARMRVENGVVLTETCDLKGYRFGGTSAGPASGPVDAARKPPCSICIDQEGHIPVTLLSAGNSRFSFALDNVFSSPTRNRSGEMSLLDLLAADGDQFRSIANAELATAKILSAFTCIVGVIMGFLAVAVTTHRTRAFALPVASALMMGVMVLVNSQIGLVDVGAGRISLLLKTGAIVLACVPLAMLAASLTYGRLIAPALARP